MYFIDSYHSYLEDMHSGSFFHILLLGLFLITWLLFIIVLQAFIHESGHLILGFICGYRFISFRIFGFTLTKVDGKYRVNRYSTSGTFGQCLMEPGERSHEKAHILLYTMGGVVADVIAAAISGCLFVGPNNIEFPCRMAFFLSTIYFLGSAFINGVPMKSGMINNDGTNLCYYLEDHRAVKGGLMQMKAAALLQSGSTYKQMPKEIVKPSEGAAISNGILAWHKILECYYYMDLKLWKQALECLQMLENQNGIRCKSLCYTIWAEKLYLYIIMKRSTSEIEALYTKVRSFLEANTMDLNVIRVYLAYEFYKDKSEKNRGEVSLCFLTKAKNYPYRGEAIFCEGLLTDLLNER